MLSPIDLAEALAALLPSRGEGVATRLAFLLTDALSQRVTPDEIQTRLHADPALRDALRTLVGQHIAAGGAQVAFGPGSQVGDIAIGSVAGRDVFNITFNVQPDGSRYGRTPSLSSGLSDRESPFIVGPPISEPRLFFGRARELQRLFGLLRRLPLQNAAIIGPRRSGKTSLLNCLRRIGTMPPAQLRPGQRNDWLPQPERYRWVYVDFQNPRLGSREGLISHLVAGLGLPPLQPCTLERFIEIAAQYLRDPAVILLDEVGVALTRYPELDVAFWEGLRALATNEVGGQLGFVLAAHEAPDQLAMHNQLGSPFFNIFGYTATLSPFTEPEAYEMIQASPVPFAPKDVAWMLTESGRWPILLQICCRELLAAREIGDESDAWREDARAQTRPFRHLIHPIAAER